MLAGVESESEFRSPEQRRGNENKQKVSHFPESVPHKHTRREWSCARGGYPDGTVYPGIGCYSEVMTIPVAAQCQTLILGVFTRRE